MMRHMLVREMTAEILFVLDLCLLLILALYMLRKVQKAGGFGRGLRPIYVALYDSLSFRLALGLFVLMAGHVLIRGMGTLLFWALRSGHDAFGIESRYPFVMIGTMIAVVGMVCLIRICSPPEWKNWGWIGSLIASVLFVGFMQLI